MSVTVCWSTVCFPERIEVCTSRETSVRCVTKLAGYPLAPPHSSYVKYMNALYMEASLYIAVKVFNIARDDDGSERAHLGERHHASHFRVAFQNSNSLRIDDIKKPSPR